MKEQTYTIKKGKSFNLKSILECGQCFRWKENYDGSYTGVFGENVINAKELNDEVVFSGMCKNDIKKEIDRYFDLDRDYEKIKKELAKRDKEIIKSIEYGFGIRILNQELFETIISFIISANNNIPRIKGIIERISKNYGDKVIVWGEEYYLFPTVEQLKNVTVEEYRKMGLGFRDKRIYETVQKIINKEVDLEKIKKSNLNTAEVREQILKLSGVGPKVCDCILLFSSLKKLDVFPIDVWVRRVMNDIYIKQKDETKVSKIKIEKIALEKFGNLQGIAQQYLFYWRREA